MARDGKGDQLQWITGAGEWRETKRGIILRDIGLEIIERPVIKQVIGRYHAPDRISLIVRTEADNIGFCFFPAKP